MRVLDMRLFVFITLILLTAAMPANCAEEGPTSAGVGCAKRIVTAGTPVFAHIFGLQERRLRGSRRRALAAC